MCPHTDACPDPEAQRPPAPPGSACRPLPWALSAALLLLAGTGAACALRWAAPRAPAAPSPGLPELPELLPDARARLPDSPQVRCARNPFSYPGPREHPFFIQDFGGHPRETPSASRAPEGNPFSIADPEGSSLSPTGAAAAGGGASVHFTPFLSPQGVFAQLVARDVQLTEGPLHWYSDPGLAGVFLGPGLSYDQHTGELMVAEPGVYYVFLNLKLQRVVSGKGSGSVSAALHLQPLGVGAAALALTLDLPPPSSEARDSAAGFWGSLLHLGAGQRLGVHLRAEEGAHLAWQLAQGATILGLFRVATKVPAGLLSSWPIDTGPGSGPLDRE
ncbi:tumor necrosis factor ligand superfamily member 9 [Neomonachus schauinslandi]|uniref:Tumor necrosis factor ligand superfamily member 9 n=1 Tax=Neomonachus schauinslandi TaxID=29088 RepID=A0A2Y9IIJ5_NEOSC|nr:tumor necrosis factor ligand superfamily member 9 [Neomonachus schauinslandi]